MAVLIAKINGEKTNEMFAQEQVFSAHCLRPFCDCGGNSVAFSDLVETICYGADDECPASKLRSKYLLRKRINNRNRRRTKNVQLKSRME